MRQSVVLCLILAVACAMGADVDTATPPVFPWQRPPVQGSAPPGRNGNTASLAGDELVVVGGCEHDISCFSDVHVFNTRSNQWSTVYAGAQNTPPEKALLDKIVLPPRGYHSATVVAENSTAAYINRAAYKVYVFGGQSSNGFRNDLFAFETHTKQWTKPLTPAVAPSERAGHSAVLYREKIIVFGGNSEAGYLSDAWQYDTRVNTWTKLETRGTAVPASAYHTASLVGDLMFVHGGRSAAGTLGTDVYVLDLNLLSWSKPILQGHAPAPRHGHLAAAQGKKIVFFGGCDITRKVCFSDSPVLDTERQMWVSPMPRPGAPGAVLPFPAQVAAGSSAAAGVVAVSSNPTVPHGAAAAVLTAGVPAGAASFLELGAQFSPSPTGALSPARAPRRRSAFRSTPAFPNGVLLEGEVPSLYREADFAPAAGKDTTVYLFYYDDGTPVPTNAAQAGSLIEAGDTPVAAATPAAATPAAATPAAATPAATPAVPAAPAATTAAVPTAAPTAIPTAAPAVAPAAAPATAPAAAPAVAPAVVAAPAPAAAPTPAATPAAAPVPAPAAAPAVMPMPAPTAAPVLAAAANTASNILAPAAPAPAAAPVAVANVTAPTANATAPAANATAVNATTAPVVVSPVPAPLPPVPFTLDNVIADAKLTYTPHKDLNQTVAIQPATTEPITRESLPKILGLKTLIDRTAAEQRDRELNERSVQRPPVFSGLLRAPAGQNYGGAFTPEGDMIVTFGGCPLFDGKCGGDVLYMHVNPKTDYQIALH